MSRRKHQVPVSDIPLYTGRQELRVQNLGYFCGVLCGLVILATVITTILLCNSHGPSSGMEAGFVFLILIPLSSIPVGIICLYGAVVSAIANFRNSSPEARTGLWLSLGGPVAVVICYAACWGIIVATGV